MDQGKNAVQVWDEDIASMEKAIARLFSNDFDGCEELLKTGFERKLHYIPGTKDSDGEVYRDIRSAFGLIHALVSLMRGIASFADDQFKECIKRLQKVEVIAAEADDWSGKKVIRGVTGLLLGVVQILQQQYIPGALNLLKSWAFIRSLKSECINYEGKERCVVRSAALLTLGGFYLTISMLPPVARNAASWFTFDGTREEGVELFYTCFEERGLLHPWAALVLGFYFLDTKTFLGEPLNEKESMLCESVMGWASRELKDSIFFTFIKSDHIAVTQRNLPLAIDKINESVEIMSELPALKWLLNYKRGAYCLGKLQFFQAGQYFRESLQVYIKVGRRSMVPYMGAYAMLCFMQAASTDENTKECIKQAEEMLALLKDYKDMNKSNWRRQDQFGFSVFDTYRWDVLKKSGSSRNSVKTVQNVFKKGKGVFSRKSKAGKGNSNEIDNFYSAENSDVEVSGTDMERSANENPHHDLSSNTDSKHTAANYFDFYIFDKEPVSQTLVVPSTQAEEKLSDKKCRKLILQWPLLQIVEIMVLQNRATWWMSNEDITTMIGQLDTEYESRKKLFKDYDGTLIEDLYFRLLVCKVDLHRQMKEYHTCYEYFKEAIEYEHKLDKVTVDFGYIPLLYFTVAQIHFLEGDVAKCKQLIRKANAYSDYSVYEFVKIKCVALQDSLGIEIDDFKKIDVAPGSKVTFTISIPEGFKHDTIKWYWIVSSYNVTFSAVFKSDDGSVTNELQHFENKECIDNEATSGQLLIGDEEEKCSPPGVLTLTWDNRFSYFRSKTVKYKIYPDDLEFNIQSANS